MKCYVYDCNEVAIVVEKIHFKDRPQSEVYTFYCCKNHQMPKSMVSSNMEFTSKPIKALESVVLAKVLCHCCWGEKFVEETEFETKKTIKALCPKCGGNGFIEVETYTDYDIKDYLKK